MNAEFKSRIKLSIITINRDDCPGLRRTMNSVLSQSVMDFEYIIIDGDSTDGSKELLEQYFDKLSYCVSEKDKGIYHAMNKGIEAATGEYLLFLNSGDWLYNDSTIETVEKHLQDFDIVYGDVINVDTTGKEWLHNPPSELSLYELGYGWNSLPHQAMFIKKRLFDLYGRYDESLKMVADWAFYLIAIFKYNCSYKRINDVVSYYSFGGFSSDMNNEALQKTERAVVIDRHFKNYNGLIEEFSVLKSKTWNYEHSRLIRGLRKIGLLKF
ncbi:MAG TPA: glycosyltransferase family 2 protein [Parafilimonas sp.]|nr:glycosyltransferase family 2 protein [Parafilimonas sp.]